MEIALEQDQRATLEGSESIILESEEVKITPPARRKRGEKMKNKVDSKSPLTTEEVMTSDHCSNTLPLELSTKQEQDNNVSSQGDDMNFESHETKNEVLKDSCTDKDSANEARANAQNCIENSSVMPNDLAAYANETNSVQSSNESKVVKEDLSFVNERKDDLASSVGFQISRESCKSLNISASASQDEESFFSADEAETSRELQSSTLCELAETMNEETETESALSVNNENTNTKRETNFLDEGNCQEIAQAQIENYDQRSTFEVSKESVDSSITSGFQESPKETLSTEPSFIESSQSDDVCEPIKTDYQDSRMSVDTDLGVGATGGVVEFDSDTDEEWSSSSYTSSEGEYDVNFAERVCGIQEDQDSEQDTCSLKDGVEEILSAFPNNYFTQIVSVTTDSESDSNKGDSLNSTFKMTEESSAENNFSPLNIMSDEDENDAGEQILSHFPQSVCPVIVDITGNDPVLNTDGNTVSLVSKEKYKSIDDERTSGDEAATVDGLVLAKDSGHRSVETVSDTEPVEADHQSCENISVSDTVNTDETDGVMEAHDQENKEQPVKRTGSFRLVNDNGVLKVIDSDKIPVTTENVKEARLLKSKSLKKVSIENGGDHSESDSAEARKQLDSTLTQVNELDREFQNVFKNIAELDRMTSIEGAEKTTETEGEASKGDLVDGNQDFGTVIISVDSMSSGEQRPKIRVEGDTTIESMTDEQEDSAQECEINGVMDGTDSSSSTTTKKRPKRLANTKRYSLGTESALLSPEDDNHVELTNFGSSSSIKSDESSLSSSDSQTDIASTVSIDGQQTVEATPSPPPRAPSGKHKSLNYSGSFNVGGGTRPLPVMAQSGHRRLPRRTRSQRSQTMPIFDVASDRISRLFTSSSSPEPSHLGQITLITDNMPATFTDFPIDRRAQVALELYTTERSYVRGLETILQLFKKPCEENKFLDKKESHTMFSNIQDIFSVNKDVMFMLQERVTHWNDEQCLGDIFSDQIIYRMKIYAKYCNNYDSAEALYKQKIKKKEFESFINACYEHHVCQPGLNLPAYLITVVQRIPRYLLLLEDFFKRTPENHPDHSNLSKALTKMSNLAVYINNQLQTTVGQKAMVDLRSRVEGLKAFEAPGRALIKEADVVLSGSRKTRKCLLFNDMLVFAIKGVTKTSEVEQTLELVTLWCMDLEGNNPQSVKDDSLEIYTPEQSYILEAGTKTEKKAWLQKLRMRIAMALHGAEATEKNEIESRKANFTYKDGRIFSGNFVSGKRHGDGTLSWPNQAKYQGVWEDDERNGLGDLTYNSGDKYRGEWLDDKQHGIGKMEYTTGDVYHGEWNMGDIHGQGKITYKNGDQFAGEFYHNEIEGIGELRCVSGLTYKGEWKHSKKHGQGKMHFPNGDVYSGQFANDRISGQGEMQYADNSVYKGQWVDNQRGGHGEFRSSDGTHYVGGWSGDHITGKGCMTYSNGDCYDGNWFKNTRYGQGVMKYSNGDTYEGVFEYDLRSKQGKMTYKDGSVYEGSWANGLRHGKGKMFYSHKKSKFEGEWMLGLRHGEGVLTFANEASYSGLWKFDKQHGRGMYTDPSTGYRYEGEWQNGFKHGKGVEQTTEGTYEGEWKDNMRHGQGREILSCESEFEGRWKENKKHGQGIKKLKTGRMEEQVWREGQQVDLSSVVVLELPHIQRR